MLEELLRVPIQKDTAITIGVFDGVHLGHQSLIGRARDEAKARGLQSLVLTFKNHPRTITTPGFKPRYLMSLEGRLELIRSLRVDFVVAISFTQELSQLTPREFVSLLTNKLRMKALVAGPDFALGKNREGDLDTLRRLGAEMGFQVIRVDRLLLRGQPVSSTAIREALVTGDLDKANRLLGRPFTLNGRVVEGERRGRLLGFPTANLEIDAERALPSDGVYATNVYLNGAPRPSVSYFGDKPTFHGLKHSREVYVLDFQGDLYGQDLTIDVVEKLRGDIKFSSAEELVGQMNVDVAKARKALLDK